MSIYFELRLTGTLSLKDKEGDLTIKLREYLKRLITSKDNRAEVFSYPIKSLLDNAYCKKMVEYVPMWRKDSNFEIDLSNRFEPDEEYRLNALIAEVEDDVFKIDCCIGSKSVSDLDLLILILAEYTMEDFVIYFYAESYIIKVNDIKGCIDTYVEGEYTECCMLDSFVNETSTKAVYLPIQDNEDGSDDISLLHKGLENYTI